jgi:Zinc knuckle
LKNGPGIHSSSYKALVEEVVGEDVAVRALSQRVLVECRNLDDVTQAADLREALKEQFTLTDADVEGNVRLRKTYGSTQAATINVPVDVANKLLKVGKVKVGWSVCHLRAYRQLLRCFKCMEFGHQAKNCQGVDRSKACWNCGKNGHQGKACKDPPRCMLCKVDDGNEHSTGGRKCKAYLEALSRKAWK